MQNFQVTIGAGATPLIAAGQKPVYASWGIIQANGPNNIRVGGTTVVAGDYGTGSGALVYSSSGSITGTFDIPRGSCLNTWFIAGTEGDVVDVVFEKSS